MRYNKAAVVYSRTGLKVIATHKKHKNADKNNTDVKFMVLRG